MSNGGFARIKYYRGQMLTARDFEDQQEYHRGKQKLLLRRFPPGIIGGLVVTCSPKGSDPDDSDGFLIGEGLAVDPEGNELVVPEEGLKVPIDEFKSATPYLGLAYEQSEQSVGEDPCGGTQKNNRVVEGVTHTWDSVPNMGPNVTVALIQLKDVKDPGTTCDKYNDPMKPVVNVGDPPIRKNARVVDTEEITDGAVTDRKIRSGAVTAAKLAPNAIVTDKLLNGAVTDTKLANNAVTTDSAMIRPPPRSRFCRMRDALTRRVLRTSARRDTAPPVNRRVSLRAGHSACQAPAARSTHTRSTATSTS